MNSGSFPPDTKETSTKRRSWGLGEITVNLTERAGCTNVAPLPETFVLYQLAQPSAVRHLERHLGKPWSSPRMPSLRVQLRARNVRRCPSDPTLNRQKVQDGLGFNMKKCPSYSSSDLDSFEHPEERAGRTQGQRGTANTEKVRAQMQRRRAVFPTLVRTNSKWRQARGDGEDVHAGREMSFQLCPQEKNAQQQEKTFVPTREQRSQGPCYGSARPPMKEDTS